MGAIHHLHFYVMIQKAFSLFCMWKVKTTASPPFINLQFITQQTGKGFKKKDSIQLL